jgi:Asp-tRNA(Asn)/Glu-tRNA(Gln) amidotransferase A subunit family amidase
VTHQLSLPSRRQVNPGKYLPELKSLDGRWIRPGHAVMDEGASSHLPGACSRVRLIRSPALAYGVPLYSPAMMLSAAQAGRMFRKGSLTPEQLTDELLRRIAVENPRLNAYYEVFESGARGEAEVATRELASGRDRGPLHGIPLGIKDLFDVAGHVTTAGAHPGFHPPKAAADCEVVRRLRAAGAVLLGKTAVHEWALGVSTNNQHFGPTRNPHAPDRIPGGSSGGSGAALAADLATLALGTDTGGSIRIPAALCGVVGLKPTYGRVSLRGVTPLAKSLDHAGPMARSVEDAFLLLEGMCGFRPEKSPPPRKILLPTSFFFEEVDPAIEERVREAARGLGEVEEVDVGDIKAVLEANTVILYCDAAAYHEKRLQEHPDWFGMSLKDRLPVGLQYRGIDYARARDMQRDWTERLTRLLSDGSVLVAPTTAVTATVIGDREGSTLGRLLSRLTAPFNLAGAPVLSVPIGKIGGLPAGMQIVAAPGRESLLREVGERHEATFSGATIGPRG